MPLGELGAVLLFLVGVLVFGNLWFHAVEAILNRVKRFFSPPEEPPPWHPLPPQEDETQE